MSSAARRLERCVASGGVAVFPADTVYGLACDPDSPAAVERLYALKGRPPAKPAAVMCFGAAPPLPELGPRTRVAVERLTPGGVTLLLPNPEGRWPLENVHEGQVHFELENGEGKPSRWNTLRAMRVLDWSATG